MAGRAFRVSFSSSRSRTPSSPPHATTDQPHKPALTATHPAMPKIRTSRTKAPPEGFAEVEPQLLEFERKMREAEDDKAEGKRKAEAGWPIFRLHHQRSRYVFELYYKRRAISKLLYDYLVKQGYADANLIAKWRKNGYENLCCLRCVQPADTNHGRMCICRVPKSEMAENKVVECYHCGCRGCCG
ncbi:Component of the SF3b subcomplex of the U2 snRNP [Blastocladiella emersonii ATCC 22665]|nr:Component of the SF3b subcomplex of the U2 snRNP [Blastocladiella emersonii ATCC 22665]